jgi:hypothetical protein
MLNVITTPEQEKAEKIRQGLGNFYGTEAYHYVSIFTKKVVATDGVMWLSENANAFWLMDIITSVLISKSTAAKFWQNGFSSWTLKVKDNKGVVTADDGNDHPLYSQAIPYTDFPLDEIILFVELGETVDGEAMVILLPSEH